MLRECNIAKSPSAVHRRLIGSVLGGSGRSGAEANNNRNLHASS